MLTQDKINQMKQQLKQGVQVVSAPQLFPTPVATAQEMARRANIADFHEVLEPSAGTGRLIDAILPYGPTLTINEVNYGLVQGLREKYSGKGVICCHGDFLTMQPTVGYFDRIVMNPPFKNGEDIKHIKHAMTLLAPGGRLVSLCAAGPRQKKAFEDYWIGELPPGSFQESGTGVNVAMIIFDKEL